MRHMTLAKGGDGDVLSVKDDAVVLSCSISYPPGARFDATLASGEAVRFKSHGSHKEEDGRFTVKGRLIDANRAIRETLATLAPREGKG